MNKEKNMYEIFLDIVKKIFSNKIIITLLTLNIILVVILVYIIFIKKNEPSGLNSEETINSEALVSNDLMSEIENIIQIKIHITGEVKKSGIYELEEGARISDAIEKAGGVTQNADLSKVNLAYQILDGQKIVIPSINAKKDGNYITEEPGENVIEEEKDQKEKININTATVSELTTLSGVGESTAKKIIKYREENGSFKDIEDLKNVSGIGESKYNQMKDYIRVK